MLRADGGLSVKILELFAFEVDTYFGQTPEPEMIKAIGTALTDFGQTEFGSTPLKLWLWAILLRYPQRKDLDKYRDMQKKEGDALIAHVRKEIVRLEEKFDVKRFPMLKLFFWG